MKLPKHLRERRDKLASTEGYYSVTSGYVEDFGRDYVESAYKNGYDTAVADTLKEIETLVEALNQISLLPKGAKPTELDAIYAVKKAAAVLQDWQKKFGGEG